MFGPHSDYDVFRHFVQQGHSEKDVKEAMSQSSSLNEVQFKLNQKKEQDEINKAIELSLKTSKTENFQNQMANPFNEEEEISKAIEFSLKEQVGTTNFAFLQNPLQRIREKDIPVGIVNIGNSHNNIACYFNSLLQAYFRLPFFAEKVLQFEMPKKEKIENDLSKLPPEKKKRALV